MSLNIKELPTVKVQEPRISIDDKPVYAILEGGSEVSYKPFTSTSYSNSSFIFSCPPPNPNICVDRMVRINVPVTVTLKGTTTAGALFQSNEMAFRDNPIARATSTLAVTINNATCSVNMADVYPVMARYQNPQCLREHYNSTTPSMLDQSQNYADVNQTFRNPLAKYADSYEMSRGGFPMNVVSNTTTEAVITSEITEPIYLSPFLFGSREDKAFIRAQTMDFNFTFLSGPDLGNAMWSYNAAGSAGLRPGASTITSIEIQFGQPRLLFCYITPKELAPIQKYNIYPYFVVDRYFTDYGTPLSQGSIVTISSNNIQLRSVPNKMYICCKKPRSSFTAADTDSYLSIQKVVVNYQNRSGLLSAATAQDLYRMSASNGCNLSWTQWSGGPTTYVSGTTTTPVYTVGSVLCIDFGKDIGLNDLMSPGILSNQQLQVDVTVKQLSNTTFVPQIMIVVVSEGTINMVDNRTVQQIGVISEADVLDSKESPSIDYNAVQAIAGGGDFFSSLKTIGKDIYKGLEKAAPIIEDAYTVGKTIAPYAAMLAAGDGGVLMEGRGGAVVGGRAISRNDLRKRLR